MRPTYRSWLPLLAAASLGVLAACGDARPTNPVAPELTHPRLTVDLPACQNLTSAEMITLINNVFGAGSPNANAALGKWDNIQKQKTSGNTTEVTSKTWNLVDFILVKRAENKLPSNEDLQELVRELFCYAGIDAGYPGGGGWVLYPGDAPRTVVTDDGQAGMIIPGDPVDQISILSITPTSEVLNTKLDKYPVNYQFSKYPDNTFTSAATAAVCATAPPGILDRLVLGHNKSATDFELLPKQPADFLSCVAVASNNRTPSLFDKLLAFVAPKVLYAAAFEGVVGVGGSVFELSPIGPVDPVVNVTKNATGSSAPIGSLVTPAPSVTLATPQGTLFQNVPVDFAVTSGGGTITPLQAATDLNGVAATTSWRLGLTPGANSVSATPTFGGDAVNGVQYAPASVSFNATATPPSAIVITSSPAGGSYTAGSTLPATSVKVVDLNGATVEGYTGAITVSATPGPFASGTTSLNAVAGLASFSDLVITKAGAHTLGLSATYGANTFSSTSGSFTITPAAAATLAINGGNNQSAPVGTTLGVTPYAAPSVLVTDAYNNVVPGATVYFAASNNSATVTPLVNPTNASGIASASWTLQAGTNEMIASLDAVPVSDPRFKLFTATGTTTSTQITSCGPGNQRDPITGYAARMSGINNKKITDVKFYFSVNGSANQPTPYPMRVTAKVYNASGTLLNTVQSAISNVYLRGSNSEQKEANFTFPMPGISSANSDNIVFSVATTAPVSGVISWNVGDCAPGTKCSIKPACPSVEVPLATPLGTAYRMSTAIKVFGY
jgi:hypothetical protein